MPNCTEKLEYVLDNVNDWLKFAEAKNGTLLALNSVFSFGMIRVILTESLKGVFFYCLVACATCSLLSGLVCLLSFLPRLDFRRSKITLIVPETQKLNVMYFGDIAKLSKSNDYLQYLLRQKIVTDEVKSDLFALDLIDQIFINSKIAKSKYGYFVISVIFTVIFILLILVLMYLWVLDKALLHGLLSGVIFQGR